MRYFTSLGLIMLLTNCATKTNAYPHTVKSWQGKNVQNLTKNSLVFAKSMFNYVNEISMLKVIVPLIITLLTSVVAFADDIIIDDSTPTKKLQQIFPIYGDVNLLPTTRILYDKPRIITKIVYPKIESVTQDDNINQFNDAVTELTNGLADEYKKQVADLKDVQASLPKSELHNNLTIDFDSSTINANEAPIISIRFSAQGYIAGNAHPYHTYRVLNYDLDGGERIELTDLFKADSNYLEVLSEYSRSVLSRKLSDKNMINEGTEPKPENFQNWNIKPYGLMITFNEYQVAPYVNGPQTVLIPFSAIKGMLASDTALANCLKHQKRCFRNRLLTGGFIDEASAKPTKATQAA